MSVFDHLLVAFYGGSTVTALQHLWWLPFMTVMLWIQNSLASKKSENEFAEGVVAALGGFALLGMAGGIGMMIYSGFDYFVAPFVERLPIVGGLWRTLLDWLGWTYAWWNMRLAPATDGILYTAFLLAVVAFCLVVGGFMTRLEERAKAAGKKIPHATSVMLMMVLAFVVALGLPIHVAMLGIFKNPVSIFPYLGFALGFITLFPRLVNINARKLSTREERGVTFRGIEKFEFKQAVGLFTLGIVLVVLLAFWFRLEITEQAQLAFFSTAVGGLLAIIGFAALVFTFTYETIGSMNIRRIIAEDTKSFQLAATVVIITSIFGLCLASDPLVLDPDTRSVGRSFRSGLIVCAFCGLLIAATSVLALFTHVADTLIKRGKENAILNFWFFEGNTAKENSALSGKPAGLSELQIYLEDQGCEVKSFNHAELQTLVETPRLVIAVPRTNSPLTEEQFDPVEQIVAMGSILILITDAADLPNKERVLQKFGFSEPLTTSGDDPWPLYVCSEDKDFARQQISSAFKPVIFAKSDGQFVLMRTAQIRNQDGTVAEDIIVARRVGRGWVIVVGTLQTFENQHLSNKRNFRQVDCLLQAVLGLMPPERPAACFVTGDVVAPPGGAKQPSALDQPRFQLGPNGNHAAQDQDA